MYDKLQTSGKQTITLPQNKLPESHDVRSLHLVHKQSLWYWHQPKYCTTVCSPQSVVKPPQIIKGGAKSKYCNFLNLKKFKMIERWQSKNIEKTFNTAVMTNTCKIIIPLVWNTSQFLLKLFSHWLSEQQQLQDVASSYHHHHHCSVKKMDTLFQHIYEPSKQQFFQTSAYVSAVSHFTCRDNPLRCLEQCTYSCI